MFRLSRRADYAVRILLELAAADNERLTAQVTARRAGIPLPFFRKVVADLVDANLVVTQAGRRGGIALAHTPTSISVLNIIEAIEGPICLNACLIRPAECPRDRICPAHNFWGDLQSVMVAKMQAANLSRLAEDYHSLRRNPRPRDQILVQDASETGAPPSPAEAGKPSLILIKE
jgi:Rrf2 family protein